MKVLLLLCLIVQSSWAGVATLNEDGSFTLNKNSQQTLGIKFMRLNSTGPWLVPKESLVHVKFSKGVYRFYDGSITFVLVSTLKEEKDYVLISSSDLEAGDEIAIKGTSFLRLTEADLNSDTVDACAH